MIMSTPHRPAVADAGLREALLTAGSRLVDTLESLRSGVPGWLDGGEDSAQAREDAFVRGFAGQVAGSGGLVSDAVVRQLRQGDRKNSHDANH